MTRPLSGATLHIEIAPLLEPQWTGIPVVAAGLARALLAALPGQIQFCLDAAVIEPASVRDALARATGRFLARDIEVGRARAGTLPWPGGALPSIGLFPSVKRPRAAFDIEASVVHDLSTLITPEFHLPSNVAYHTGAIAGDLATDDLIIAVSEATRADLAAYLGIAGPRVITAPNGVAWPADFATEASNALAGGAVEPYILVLGTREPRKNIRLVFAMLEAAPELLESHRFVFAGRLGWLAERQALPRRLEAARAVGRLVFPGFVTERQKYLLLSGAAATLYPSYLEGFGLPVLESLSVGTPCIASWSSSIPEVGGGVCCYFDPFSAADCQRAIADMLARQRAMGPALATACRAQAAPFTWERSASLILAALEPIVAARLAG